jgi:lysozyme
MSEKLYRLVAERFNNSPKEWARGIDVSKWQGEIDWKKVAEAGMSFAGIKATQGERTVDKTFARNFRGALEAGIRRLPYLFWEPELDPRRQAALFIRTVGGLEDRDLPPCIDVERTTANQSAPVDNNKLSVLISELRAHYGRAPLIYTSARFVREEGYTAGGDCPLWVVWWAKGDIRLPPQWKEWAIWQIGYAPGMPGIVGDVDRNLARLPLASISMGGL